MSTAAEQAALAMGGQQAPKVPAAAALANPFAQRLALYDQQFSGADAYGNPISPAAAALLRNPNPGLRQPQAQVEESPSALVQGYRDSIRSQKAGITAAGERLRETFGGPADYSGSARLAQDGASPNAPRYGWASLLQHPLDTAAYGVGQLGGMLQGQGLGAVAGGALGAGAGALLKKPVEGIKFGAKAGAFLQQLAATGGNTVMEQQADKDQANKSLAERNEAALASGALQSGAHYLIPSGAAKALSPATAVRDVVDHATGKVVQATGPVGGGLQALAKGIGQGAGYSAAGTAADQAIQSGLSGNNHLNVSDIADSAVLGGAGGVLHIPAAVLGAAKGTAAAGADAVKAGAGAAKAGIDYVKDMFGSKGFDADAAAAGGSGPDGSPPAGGGEGKAFNAGQAVANTVASFRGPLATSGKAAYDFARGAAAPAMTAASEWVDNALTKAGDAKVGDTDLRSYLNNVGAQVQRTSAGGAVANALGHAKAMWKTVSEDPVQAAVDSFSTAGQAIGNQLSSIDPGVHGEFLKSLIGDGAGRAYDTAVGAVKDWAGSAGNKVADYAYGDGIRQAAAKADRDSPAYDPDYVSRMQGAARAADAGQFPQGTTLNQMVNGSNDHAATIFDKVRAGTAANGDLQRFSIALAAAIAPLDDAGQKAGMEKYASQMLPAMQDRYGDRLGAAMTAGLMGTIRGIAGLHGTDPSQYEAKVGTALANITDAQTSAESAYSRAHAEMKLPPKEQAAQPAQAAPEENVSPEEAASANQQNQSDNADVLGLLTGEEPITKSQLDSLSAVAGVDAHTRHEVSKHLAPVAISPNDTPDTHQAKAAAHVDKVAQAAQAHVGKAGAHADNAAALMQKHMAMDGAVQDPSASYGNRFSLLNYGDGEAHRLLKQHGRSDAPLGPNGTAKMLNRIGAWLEGDSRYSHLNRKQVDEALRAQFGRRGAAAVWAELDQRFRHGSSTDLMSDAHALAGGHEAEEGIAGNHDDINPEAAGARVGTVERRVNYGKDGLPMTMNEAKAKLQEMGQDARPNKPLTADVNHRTQSGVTLEEGLHEHGYMTSALRALQDDYPGRGNGYASRLKAMASKLRDRETTRLQGEGLSDDEVDVVLAKKGLDHRSSDEDVLRRHYVVVSGNEHQADGGLSFKEWNGIRAEGKGMGTKNITVNMHSAAESGKPHAVSISPVALTKLFMARGSSDRTPLQAFHEGLSSMLTDPRVHSDQPFSSAKSSGVRIVDGRLEVDPDLVMHIDGGKPVSYESLHPQGTSGEGLMSRLRAGVEAHRATYAAKGKDLPSRSEVQSRIEHATEGYNAGSSLEGMQVAEHQQNRFEQDARIAASANKIIAFGDRGDSLPARYAEKVGQDRPDAVNAGRYTKEDSVAVFPGRNQDINKDAQLQSEVDRAISAGATVVTGSAARRVKANNKAELKLGHYLADRGYVDVGGGRWVPHGDSELGNASAKGAEDAARYNAMRNAEVSRQAMVKAGMTPEQISRAMSGDVAGLSDEQQRAVQQAQIDYNNLRRVNGGRNPYAERNGSREYDSSYERNGEVVGNHEGETEYINKQIDQALGGGGGVEDNSPRHYDELTGEQLGAYSRRPMDERQQWASETTGQLLRMADKQRGQALIEKIGLGGSDIGDQMRRMGDLERALANNSSERAVQMKQTLHNYFDRLVAKGQEDSKNAWTQTFHELTEDGSQHPEEVAAHISGLFKAMRRDRLAKNEGYGHTGEFLRNLSEYNPEVYDHLTRPDVYERIRQAEPKGSPQWQSPDSSVALGERYTPGADRQYQSRLRDMGDDSSKKAGGVRYSSAAGAFVHGEKTVGSDPVAASRYISERTGAKLEIERSLPYAGHVHGDVVTMSHQAPWSGLFHESMHHFLEQIVKDPRGAEIVRMLSRVASSPEVLGKMRELLKDHPDALGQLDGERNQHERVAYMHQLHSLGLLDVKDLKAKGWMEKVKNLLRRVFHITSEHELSSQVMDYLHKGEYTHENDPHPVSKLYRDVMSKRAPEYVQNVQRAYDSVMHTMERIQAPAVDVLRESGNTDLARIAEGFRPAAGKPASDPGYIMAHRAVASQWLNRLANITDGLDDHERELLHIYSQQMDRDGSASFKAPQSVREAYAKSRQLLDDIESHVRDAGVQRMVVGEDGKPGLAPMGHRERYFPAVYDTKAILDNLGDFTRMLEGNGMDKKTAMETARQMANGAHGSPDEYGLGYNPFFGALGERTLKLKQADIAPYLAKNYESVMAKYIMQAAKRSEYVRRFGNGGEKIRAAMDEAKAMGASDKEMALYKDAVMKLEGTAHKDVDPRWNKVMSPLLAAVNVAVLPASLLTNLGDALDIGVRSESPKEAFKALGYGLKNIWRNMRDNGENPDDRAKLAEEFGTMTRKRLEETLNSYNDQPDGSGRKINDLFFRANGVDPWNRAMLAYGTDTALNFIDSHLGKYGSSEKSKRFMDQLGIKPGDVQRDGQGKLVRDASNGKLRDAVNQWVHQAVLKPSEADTPVWFGDPRFAAFSHLKQFGYAFDNNVRHWALGEKDAGNWKPMAMLAIHVPAMMATMYMRALAMHGGVLPPTMQKWGLTDWIGEAMFRTGMWGERAGQISDLNHPAFLAGPTATLAYKGLRDTYDNWTK